MLSSPNFSDSRQSEVRLQEEPAAAAVFPAMLRFLYSGRITITHATVLPTLVLADKYNIKVCGAPPPAASPSLAGLATGVWSNVGE